MAKATKGKGGNRWVSAGINTGAAIAGNAIGNVAADKLGEKVNKKVVGGGMMLLSIITQATAPENVTGLNAGMLGVAISGAHVLAQEIMPERAKQYGLAGVAGPSYDDATPGATSDADYWAQAAAMAGLEDDSDDYAMLQDSIRVDEEINGVAEESPLIVG